MAEQRGSVSLKSFTKWPFKDDFEIRVEQGQVVWANVSKMLVTDIDIHV